MTAELIAKEDIKEYKLIHAPESHVHELRYKLQSALRLGNEFKSKSLITFQTEEGPKKVETTVWSLTDAYLQLKGGILIPLYSLLDLEY
ncbi:hypothetical protein SAMN05216436_102165 [bacterium A37T11]|nr:hypothetical protein SAMN05216436_102165 [bacterium A37T11]